jgi:hypothetical protein
MTTRTRLCGVPTIGGTPCENPVSEGNDGFCAAGHPVLRQEMVAAIAKVAPATAPGAAFDLDDLVAPSVMGYSATEVSEIDLAVRRLRNQAHDVVRFAEARGDAEALDYAEREVANCDALLLHEYTPTDAQTLLAAINRRRSSVVDDLALANLVVDPDDEIVSWASGLTSEMAILDTVLAKAA